jgi:(p)ppGpp synthase/HD superfamily hydrolase
MILSNRYDQALAFAHECHRAQSRKGTGIPYISHPLAVSSLVLEYGGSEAEAIAALLHDTLEDSGARLVEVIAERFGREVLEMVIQCSDAIPGQGQAKAPWVSRKASYLAGIPAKSPGARLVTAGHLAGKMGELGWRPSRYAPPEL